MRQQDLAAKVGVSRTTVDSWENDHSYPQRKLARLEQVLGISLDPGPAPGPLADLEPWHDEWEEQVAGDRDLSLELRRQLISDSRDARSAYADRRRAQGERNPGAASA